MATSAPQRQAVRTWSQASLRRTLGHSHSVVLLTVVIACGPCCQLAAEATTTVASVVGGPQRRHFENVRNSSSTKHRRATMKSAAAHGRCPPLEDPFQRLSDALPTPTEVTFSLPSAAC
jgi:hypothetical protein